MSETKIEKTWINPALDEEPRAKVIVAGHICLDVIPRMKDADFAFREGALESIGEVTISSGGCVSNTGLALARLGVDVDLATRVGDDMFGSLLRQCLTMPHAHTESIRTCAGEHTSYSLILSPEGYDRMVLHYSGTNDAFSICDIEQALNSNATYFHFGYPPLMRRMYENCGDELATVLKMVKDAGKVCSLDMAYPDPQTPSGMADWEKILSKALPFVDVFMPSYDEVFAMFSQNRGKSEGKDGQTVAMVDQLDNFSRNFLQMGAALVAIKLGDKGLYLRTGTEDRLANSIPDLNIKEWTGQELWSAVFEANKIGTNGAGDATIAGFLFGLLQGLSPEEVCSAACAVGACSVESKDATGGIPRWGIIERRIQSGWNRAKLDVINHLKTSFSERLPV